MRSDELKALVDRFNEVKQEKNLSYMDIAKQSGVHILRVEGLLDGWIKTLTVEETMKIADMLGVSPAEIDKICGLK